MIRLIAILKRGRRLLEGDRNNNSYKGTRLACLQDAGAAAKMFNGLHRTTHAVLGALMADAL